MGPTTTSSRAAPGRDLIRGAGGADQLTGGGGKDYYFYDTVSDSTSTRYDTIHGFNANQDTLVFFNGRPMRSTRRSTTAHCRLRASTATSPRRSAASRLHANDAVLFKPDAGTLSGHTFLIVDANGQAGYQAGEDFIIASPTPTHMANFSLINFVD